MENMEIKQFKNAAMGFDKRDVNLYLAELFKIIDQLKKENNALKKASSGNDPAANERAVAELRERLESAQNAKISLEQQLNETQASLDRAIDKALKLESKLASASSPAPAGIPAKKADEIIAALNREKARFEEYCAGMTAFFAASVTALSAAKSEAATAAATTTAAPEQDAFSEFAAFAKTSGDDDLSAFTDYSADSAPASKPAAKPAKPAPAAPATPAAKPDDTDSELSAVLDEVNAYAEFSEFADFTIDSPANDGDSGEMKSELDELAQYADFSPDLAPASGSAVTEFSAKKPLPKPKAKPQAALKPADPDDEFSEFADFQLTPDSGKPQDDNYGESFELTPGSGGGANANAGAFDDSFASLMLNPDEDMVIGGGDDLAPAELAAIGLTADGNLDPHLQEKLLDRSTGALSAHQNDDGTFSLGNDEFTPYNDLDNSDGMADFEALMMQANEENMVGAGGNQGGDWDFSGGGDDGDMTSTDFDMDMFAV